MDELQRMREEQPQSMFEDIIEIVENPVKLESQDQEDDESLLDIPEMDLNNVTDGTREVADSEELTEEMNGILKAIEDNSNFPTEKLNEEEFYLVLGNTSDMNPLSEGNDLSSPSSDIDSKSIEIPLTMKSKEETTVKPPSINSHLKNIEVLSVSKNYANRKKLYDKISYCYFCGKPIKKLTVHLEGQHSHEKLVQEFLKCPLNSKERRETIASIRKKGNEKYNTKVIETGEGVLVPKRRTRTHIDPAILRFCFYCRAMYSKSTLAEHLKRCSEKNKQESTAAVDPRSAIRLSMSLMPATLECQQVLAKILTTFNEDEVSSIAKADPLIVKLALNKLMSLGKTSTPHKDYDNVKQRMRLAARFLVIFRTLVKKKNMRLADVFRPEHQEKLYRAVWEMSGFNTTTFEFLRPSIALKIGQILTMSSGILTVEALKVNEVVKFQQINQGDWKKNIGKHVYDLLDIKRFLKISLLSLVKDVMKTHTYLSNQTTYLKNILLQQKSYRAYHELQRNVLSRIVYLNREKVGLVESLKTKFISESEKYSVTTLSLFERMLTKHLKFIQNKDRNGKTISWFMTQDLYDAVVLLIRIREEIGISQTNPYVFARLGESKKHINGAIILRQDTVTAGVENQLLSTSTFLRRHVAIVCQLLSLSELGVQVLDLDGSLDMVQLAKATKMVLTGDEDQDVDVEELIEITEEEALQVRQDFISNLLPDREEDVNEENVRTKVDKKGTKNKKTKKTKAQRSASVDTNEASPSTNTQSPYPSDSNTSEEWVVNELALQEHLDNSQEWSQDEVATDMYEDDKSNIQIEEWSSSQVIEFVDIPIPVEEDSANVEPMEINQDLEVENPIANPEQVDQTVRGKRKRNRIAKAKDEPPVKRRTSKRLAESNSALAAPLEDIQVSISLCGQQLTLTLQPDQFKRTYECKHTLSSGQQLTISLQAPPLPKTNDTSHSNVG